ncbi:hypothetical protein L2D08_14265 [Domibacillus sp. PGB-M46]|uniref:hypothetical protein n=1 Tax=Domibacillus sp. PGB-M46 TaxID=2910255 RepID=UPI001F561703|nr:hypothetical protein [Domibacillus sp. PGB-M46]MCI2255535.1 hypothetical protein [Domibacillus sp. PGB-M46]
MKRLVFFIIGALLFIISVPSSTKMVMELINDQKMNVRYTITGVNTGYPSVDPTFHFQDHLIEIEETIKNEEGYIDPWDNKIVLADLTLKLDGVQVDTLSSYPIRAEESGLNRYHGEIAYLMLKDKKMNKTDFTVLVKKTRELEIEKPNGDIVGGVPEDKLTYNLYRVEDGGNIKRESFRFTERNELQTELLNASAIVPYAIGYYTDAWEWYPTIFFPWIFPFLSLFVGFVLVIVCFPYRKISRSHP